MSFSEPSDKSPPDNVKEISFKVPARLRLGTKDLRLERLSGYGLSEMMAYFENHKAGHKKWAEWGGAAGRRWARRIWGKYGEQIMARLKEDQAEQDTAPTVEPNEMYADTVYLAGGPTSFVDLHAAHQADESADKIRELTYQFQDLTWNILNDSAITNKTAAIKALTNEYTSLIDETLDDTAVEVDDTAEADVLELAEFAGHALKLTESESGTNRRAPLDLDVVIIQPGFGNKKDNHYYSEAMLKECAQVFVGAKMYTTDHRVSEKSERTEVSKIREMVGFHDGAPVGRAAVFDPDFAEKVRNRADAGELQSLECSILAGGSARPGLVGGKNAKIVEAITDVNSIDWVTRAGAGGHALRLSESEVNTMSDEKEKELAELEEVKIEEGEEAADAQAPAADTDEAPQGDEAKEPQGDEAKTVEPTESEPVKLSEADVSALIPDHLPEQTRTRLLAETYQTEQDAKAAIVAEVDYLRAVTGSGKPFGTASSAPAPVVDLSEAAEQNIETHKAVSAKYFGG